jgi:hypothetical protein
MSSQISEAVYHLIKIWRNCINKRFGTCLCCPLLSNPSVALLLQELVKAHVYNSVHMQIKLGITSSFLVSLFRTHRIFHFVGGDFLD